MAYHFSTSSKINLIAFLMILLPLASNAKVSPMMRVNFMSTGVPACIEENRKIYSEVLTFDESRFYCQCILNNLLDEINDQDIYIAAFSKDHRAAFNNIAIKSANKNAQPCMSKTITRQILKELGLKYEK